MSSYADIAAKNAPEEKSVPLVTQEDKAKIQETRSKAESIIQKEAEKLKEVNDKLKKDAEKARKETKNILGKIYDFVSARLSTATDKTYKGVLVTKEELKNPVVSSQLVIVLAAVTSGILAKDKIFNQFGKTLNDKGTAIVVAGATSLLLVDGLLVKKYYRKFK